MPVSGAAAKYITRLYRALMVITAGVAVLLLVSALETDRQHQEATARDTLLSMHVNAPRHWTAETPNLYRLTVELAQGGSRFLTIGRGREACGGNSDALHESLGMDLAAFERGVLRGRPDNRHPA